MIYSKSTQYAIRALSRLAKLPAGEVCRLEVIAREEQIPQHFLSKILQRLVKKRMIRSTKGLGGGFSLRVPASKLTLFVIADAIDELSLSINDCVFGNKVCGEEKPCPLHESWVRVREREVDFLHGISISDLVQQKPALKK